MKIIKAGSSTVAKACYRAGDALVFDLRLQEAGGHFNMARLHGVNMKHWDGPVIQTHVMSPESCIRGGPLKE